MSDWKGLNEIATAIRKVADEMRRDRDQRVSSERAQQAERAEEGQLKCPECGQRYSPHYVDPYGLECPMYGCEHVWTKAELYYALGHRHGEESGECPTRGGTDEGDDPLLLRDGAGTPKSSTESEAPPLVVLESLKQVKWLLDRGEVDVARKFLNDLERSFPEGTFYVAHEPEQRSDTEVLENLCRIVGLSVDSARCLPSGPPELCEEELEKARWIARRLEEDSST